MSNWKFFLFLFHNRCRNIIRTPDGEFLYRQRQISR